MSVEQEQKADKGFLLEDVLQCMTTIERKVFTYKTNPLQIRFAKGEINKKEYEEMRKMLES